MADGAPSAPRRRGLSPERRRQMAAASAFLLFFLPSPLILKAIFAIVSGRVIALAWTVGVFALFMIGAELVRNGLSQEAAARAQRLARPGGLPLKGFGAALITLATFATAWILARHPLGLSLAFAAVAGAGCVLLYGVDRIGRRAPRAGDEAGKLSAALDDARRKLARIDAAAHRIAERSLQGRVDAILLEADKVLGEIERDPRDLRRARKFLNVYLDGAVEVVERYAETASRGRTEALDENFRALLTDMELVFREQHQKLLQDDVMDLDVQMEVLRTRLKREGVL